MENLQTISKQKKDFNESFFICKTFKMDMPEAIKLVKKMKNIVATEFASHLDELSPQDLSKILEILEKYNA